VDQPSASSIFIQSPGGNLFLPICLLVASVLLITVIGGLLVAVEIWVFLANILIIEKISGLARIFVSASDPSEGDVPFLVAEKELLRSRQGKVVLIHFCGPMIFGIGQTMARESARIKESVQVLVFAIGDVTCLDWTIGLSIENKVNDVVEENSSLYDWPRGAGQVVHVSL